MRLDPIRARVGAETLVKESGIFSQRAIIQQAGDPTDTDFNRTVIESEGKQQGPDWQTNTSTSWNNLEFC